DVDDDSFAGRVAGVTVAARTRDDADRVPPRPAHRPPDVLGRLAEDDRAGTDAVVARAVEEPRGVVGGVRGRHDRPLNQFGELDETRIRRRARAGRDPPWERGQRAGADREPSTADEQLAAVEAFGHSRSSRATASTC